MTTTTERSEVYQVAVNLGVREGSDPKRYKDFFESVASSRGTPLVRFGSTRLTGDYDVERHIFYCGRKEDADAFSEKVGKSDLVESVHVDVIPA